MADAFSNSRDKIAWAEKRFTELAREIEQFIQMRPYSQVIEPDPEHADRQVHKMKLTKPFPSAISRLLTEVAQHLRNALDDAVYSVAAAKISTPKYAAFPFAGSLAHMVSALGRCKDLTPEMQSLMVGFQPYFGGNDTLWALNEVAVSEKHKSIVPIGQGNYPAGVNIGGTGFFNMPQPHIWDREKNEMVLVTLGTESTFNYQFHFRLFVAFNNIRVVDGEHVLPVLHEMGFQVGKIINTIEFEAKRLKIV